MKKQLKLTALLSTAALGFVFATPVLAADTTPQTGTTNAYISFHSKTTGTDPLDPSDPNTTDPGNGTGNTGDLTLDAVPNTLNFGDHELSETTLGNHTYTLLGHKDGAITPSGESWAKQDSSTNDPETTDVNGFVYTQVTDVRGTGAGWHLTAELASFKNGGADTLDGAVMSFANGKVQKLTTGADNKMAWAAGDITLVGSPLNLVAGGGVTDVEDAATGTGRGTQQAVWDTSNVTLSVPKDSAKPGNATSQITWTLTNAPA